MDWKQGLTRTPYLVLFVVLISIGVGTASALITITLAGNVIITDDLTVDTGTLFVDSSQNRIGIGTTSPASALHITAGGADFSPNENGIQLTGSDIGGNAGIELTTDGGIPFIDFKNDTGPGDYDARIILHGDDALAIRGTNVGIDVNYPEEKLDVAGNVKIDGNYTFATNQTRTLIISPHSYVPKADSEFVRDFIFYVNNFQHTSVDGGAATLYAPINGIPDGAVIQEFSCNFKNADSSHDVQLYCTLLKHESLGSAIGIFGISNSTYDNSGITKYTDVTPTSYLDSIFDSSKEYTLQITLDPLTSNCDPGDCELYQSEIKYQVSKTD